MHYYWIRIFNYDYQPSGIGNGEKGELLNEFYYESNTKLTRPELQQKVKIDCGFEELMFAKPRKKSGIYAIVMDSDKFFYDRHCKTVDTHCFHCYKKIVGQWKDFPRDFYNEEEVIYCSYDCKSKVRDMLHSHEGEWQDKENPYSETIYGYIYLIYNRAENKHYIGQTRFLPFFRWQEHGKSKGNLEDLTFSIITSVIRCGADTASQDKLNSIEAWWIQKYQTEFGKENVMNITTPQITYSDLKAKFESMVIKQGAFIQ